MQFSKTFNKNKSVAQILNALTIFIFGGGVVWCVWRYDLIINYFPILSLYFGIILVLTQQDYPVLNLTSSLFCLINCHKLGISFSINLIHFQICQ